MTDFTANTFFGNLDTVRTTADKAALEQCRQDAADAYREVIYPWWNGFVGSQAALDLAVLLPEQPRGELRLTSDLNLGRKQTGGGVYIALGGDVRSLNAAVRHQVEGRTPTGYAGSMLAAIRRPIPLTHPELPADFNMTPATVHPLVLVDFAEQITAGVVDAHIRRHLRR
jgi:hypothetical protein